MGNVFKKKQNQSATTSIDYIFVNAVLLGTSDSGSNQLMTSFNNSAPVPPDQSKPLEAITKIVHIKEDDDVLHFKFKVSEPVDYKKFKTVMPTYYQDNSAVVLVYNPESRASFDALEDLFLDITFFNPKKLNLPMLLVCNDQTSVTKGQRQVTLEEGETLARKFQMPHHIINTAKYEHVDDVFSYCAREGIQRGVITRNVPETQSFALEPKNV